MKKNLLILFCLLGIFNLTSQTVITVGSAALVSGGSESSPINIYYKSHHCQVLYTTADINSGGWLTAGVISKLGFNISGTTTEALPNFNIKLKNTTASNVTNYDGAGLNTVYTSASYFPTAGGFELLTLDNTFTWDGTSNLLVDICFDQVANYTSTGQVFLYPYTNPGAHYAFTQDDLSPTCGTSTNVGPSKGYNNSYKPQIQFELTALPPCTGSPAAGNAVSTSTNVCANTSFDLNLVNNAVESGITYQWQSSPNGSSWTNLGSVQVTPLMHINSLSGTTYYQCVSTCTASTLSATSTPVMINLNPLMNCYCTPSHSWSCTNDNFTDFSLANIVSQTTNCDPSGYSDSTSSNYITINLTAANTYTLSGNAVVSGFYGDAAMGAWIDYNHNAFFEPNEFTSLGFGPSGTYSNTLTVPVTAPAGVVRMRLKLDEYYASAGTILDPCYNNNGSFNGQTLDYKVNITAAPACVGAPNAGNAISTQTAVCLNVPYVLNLSGNDAVSDISYQWQSSPNGTVWTNLGTAQTTIPYSVASQTSTTYYQCVMTCTSAALSGTSTPVVVTQNLPTACYCTPESIDCSSAQITNVTLESILHAPSCDPSGYIDYTGIAGTASLTATQTHTISLDLNCQSAPGYVGLWIDYDQSGTFDGSEYTYIGTTSIGTITANISVPYSAVGGNTAMRIKMETSFGSFAGLDPCFANEYGGQTFDYSINITPAVPCSGMPNACNVTSTRSTVCEDVPFTLNLINNDLVSNITYQWQSSPDNVIWTNIGSSQLSVPYTVTTQTVTMHYRCITTCTTSALSGTSTAVTVTQNPLTACHCTPPSSNCSMGDEINHVMLAALSNTSTCSTNGYEDYAGTVASATIQAGQSYTMTTVVGSDYNGHVAVWIDYNQNGVFDGTEFTDLGITNSIGNYTITNSITIPAYALAGNTKMRVRNNYQWSFGPDDACAGGGGGDKPSGTALSVNGANGGDGETEDYLITILPPDCSSINFPPSFNVTGSTDICPSQSTVLNIAPAVQSATGVTYEWFYFNGSVYASGGLPSATPQYTAAPAANTLYYCEVQCNTSPVRNSDTVNVKVRTITTAPTTNSATCNGLCNGNATINASSSGATLSYTWTPVVGTSDMAIALCAGTYTVDIMNPTGCLVTEIVTIAQPTPIVISTPSQTNISCYGMNDGMASVSVSGGVAPLTYSWSPTGGSGLTATNLAPGNYTFMAYDINGCNNTELFTITEPALITVNITGTTSVCQETSATYTANVANAIGVLTYTWTTSTTSQTSNDATFNYTAATAGSEMLTVSVTDANGCMQTSSNYNVVAPASTGISGVVTTNTISPVAGFVVLYKYEPFYTRFDSIAGQNLDANGAYNFPSFTSGVYIVQAIPTATNMQVAYGDSAVNWKTATQIVHGCVVNDIQNIEVKALGTFTSTGTGSLSGKLIQGNGFERSGSAFKPTIPGQPIGGIIVKGGRNPGGQMFVQTVTSSAPGAEGTYTLQGLPENTGNQSYFILVDIPGLDTNNTYHRIIDSINSNYINLDFEIDSAKITPIQDPYVGLNDITAIENKIKVFPNPASSYVTIQYSLQNSSLVKIELFDILGKSVKLLLPETQQSIDLHKKSWQTDDLRSGLYFIKVTINGSESTIKLSVNN